MLAAVGLVAAGVVYRVELLRLWQMYTLFWPDRIDQNFQHMDRIFDSRTIAHGDDVLEFERGSYHLPPSFTYAGQTYDTERFLYRVHTTGLLILHGDTIVYERYGWGHAPAGNHIGWSVTKSFVSALFGIAVQDGAIPDIEAPVTDYLPQLYGSGYDSVPIKDVLQMSSGVRFDEDYGDPFSDINRMGPAMGMGSLLDFAATLEAEVDPGTRNHYVSVDTQVLGEILVRATGQPLARYASERLWQPLGMEFDGRFLLDGTGMEWAFGGLNASLRDFARFGWLYMNRGRRGSRQIVPAEWVDASVTPDAPHLVPSTDPDDPDGMGYGYQWWIPPGSDGDYTALGVYGQNVYVDPNRRVVIVKNSADRAFQEGGFENGRIAMALWRTIARDLAAREDSLGQ